MLGRINQNVFSQTVIASADYYKGDTTFKPPEYEFKATLAFNYNRVDVQQLLAQCRSIHASARRATTASSACRNCFT